MGMQSVPRLYFCGNSPRNSLVQRIFISQGGLGVCGSVREEPHPSIRILTQGYIPLDELVLKLLQTLHFSFCRKHAFYL